MAIMQTRTNILMFFICISLFDKLHDLRLWQNIMACHLWLAAMRQGSSGHLPWLRIHCCQDRNKAQSPPSWLPPSLANHVLGV
jgi:hypothetical protein